MSTASLRALGCFALLLAGCSAAPDPWERSPTPACQGPSCGGAVVGTQRQDAGPPAAPSCGTESGVRLAVPEYFQQCSEWCWSATIAMVGAYFERSVPECQLASAKTGYACCGSAACGAPACNQAAQTWEMSGILQSLGVSARYAPSRIDEATLQHELVRGRPVIVGYRAPFAGHVAVVSGFTKTASGTVYHVVDPWPQFGAFDAGYTTIAFGPGGQMPWSDTWLGLSTAASACGPGFESCCDGR